MSKYRYDYRSPKQAREDILRGDKEEAEIAIRIAILLKSKYNLKKWPIVKPYNKNIFGKIIDNQKDLSHIDFIINDQKYQITRSRYKCNTTFNQKKRKVEKCIEDNVNIVFVNGYTEKEPQFLISSAERIKELLPQCKIHNHFGTGGKECFEFAISMFHPEEWFYLPSLPKKIPSAYKKLLNTEVENVDS